MNNSRALFLSLVIQGVSSAATAQAPAPSNGAAQLPAEVKKLLERAALCDHLAGEYDAPNSPRTAEVSQAAEANRCAFVEQELKSMKRKYANSNAVMQEIAKVEAGRR